MENAGSARLDIPARSVRPGIARPGFKRSLKGSLQRSRRLRLVTAIAAGFAVQTVPLLAGVLHVSDKLTDDEKITLVRDLDAEYAKARGLIPRSKTPLQIDANGAWDKAAWAKEAQKMGAAARLGDQVQITRVILDGDKLILELNGGLKSGHKWYDHVQVGMGASTSPVNRGNHGPSLGSIIEINFHKPMENLTPADVKKILSPLLDFDKHSVTSIYVETLPPAMQAAIKEKRAVEGMNREEVLMALGHPEHKYRETKDGVDTEDWIYGAAPGKITFVTFAGSKVVKVKEEYAGLGMVSESHPN